MTDAAPAPPRSVLVLGGLSAIARAAAELHAAEGARLVLAGRGKDRLEEVAADLRLRGAPAVETVDLDLAACDPEREAPRLVAACGGTVDVVLLAYGMLGDQARAETDVGHALAVIDVNFRSAAVWCLVFARLLEAQGAGTLAVIGSVAGDRGRRSNYVYGAAKGGLSLLVQGIAHRLAGTGARAVLIKPGLVDTPMTRGFSKGGPLWSSPERVAAAIHAATRSGPAVVHAPAFWRWIMLVIRNLPDAVMHRTKL